MKYQINIKPKYYKNLGVRWYYFIQNTETNNFKCGYGISKTIAVRAAEEAIYYV